MAEIYSILEKSAGEAAPDADVPQGSDLTIEVAYWQTLAKHRHQSIDQHLWDEQSGLYLDYSLTTESRRYYEFATTFYPLWAGIASAHQAQGIVANLSRFEAPGGVRTSTHTSGSQWDDPFGWAPLQLIAVEGLMRYGYDEAAERLARRFITLVVEDFERSGSLLEKYDLTNCSGEVSGDIQFGYSSNEIGFGWTNGVVLALLDLLETLEQPSGRQPSGAGELGG